jgi:hypothetical protein
MPRLEKHRILVLVWLLAVVFAVAPRPAFAEMVTAKIGDGKFIITGGADNKDKSISIVGITIDKNTRDTIRTDITKSGSLDGEGNYTNSNVNTDNFNSYDITIGGETFSGVTNKTTYKFLGGYALNQNLTSDKERQDAENSGAKFPHQNNLPGTDFVKSDAFSFVLQGQSSSQFVLVNSSNTPYLFTSLHIYKDLDPAFNNPTQYNSAAAIATGTLDWGVPDIQATLSIPGAGGDVSPDITLAVGPVNPNGYELLTATAVPILGDGQFGDPVSISMSIGASSVPEPSTLLLTAVGILAIVGYSCFGRLSAGKAN